MTEPTSVVRTVRIFALVVADRQTGEHRSEHGEDVRLKETHQSLDEIHEHGESDSNDGCSVTACRAQKLCREEDQPDECQKDDVSGRHVGEQTDGQREGLREDADELDRNHDWGEIHRCSTEQMREP